MHKIKETSKSAVVGFNNSTKCLGERSQEDIDFLWKLANASGNKNLLAHFETEAPAEGTQPGTVPGKAAPTKGKKVVLPATGEQLPEGSNDGVTDEKKESGHE